MLHPVRRFNQHHMVLYTPLVKYVYSRQIFLRLSWFTWVDKHHDKHHDKHSSDNCYLTTIITYCRFTSRVSRWLSRGSANRMALTFNCWVRTLLARNSTASQRLWWMEIYLFPMLKLTGDRPCLHWAKLMKQQDIGRMPFRCVDVELVLPRQVQTFKCLDYLLLEFNLVVWMQFGQTSTLV